jgi:hypothetical protein
MRVKPCLSQAGVQTGTREKIWDNAVDAAVRDSKDLECKKGMIYSHPNERGVLI